MIAWSVRACCSIMAMTPLWDQFAALLPERPVVDPSHPLGCHRPRVSDRLVFEKLLQVLRFGCAYESIADSSCSATTIRNRRNDWIALGVFERLTMIVLESYDRIVGLILEEISVDGCITKAPGGGEVAGRSPVESLMPTRFRCLDSSATSPGFRSAPEYTVGTW